MASLTVGSLSEWRITCLHCFFWSYYIYCRHSILWKAITSNKMSFFKKQKKSSWPVIFFNGTHQPQTFHVFVHDLGESGPIADNYRIYPVRNAFLPVLQWLLDLNPVLNGPIAKHLHCLLVLFRFVQVPVSPHELLFLFGKLSRYLALHEVSLLDCSWIGLHQMVAERGLKLLMRVFGVKEDFII